MIGSPAVLSRIAHRSAIEAAGNGGFNARMGVFYDQATSRCIIMEKNQ